MKQHTLGCLALAPHCGETVSLSLSLSLSLFLSPLLSNSLFLPHSPQLSLSHTHTRARIHTHSRARTTRYVDGSAASAPLHTDGAGAAARSGLEWQVFHNLSADVIRAPCSRSTPRLTPGFSPAQTSSSPKRIEPAVINASKLRSHNEAAFTMEVPCVASPRLSFHGVEVWRTHWKVWRTHWMRRK